MLLQRGLGDFANVDDAVEQLGKDRSDVGRPRSFQASAKRSSSLVDLLLLMLLGPAAAFDRSNALDKFRKGGSVRAIHGWDNS